MAAVTSTPKNTDFRNPTQKDTTLIPVCKYVESTPWGLLTYHSDYGYT